MGVLEGFTGRSVSMDLKKVIRYRIATTNACRRNELVLERYFLS